MAFMFAGGPSVLPPDAGGPGGFFHLPMVPVGGGAIGPAQPIVDPAGIPTRPVDVNPIFLHGGFPAPPPHQPGPHFGPGPVSLGGGPHSGFPTPQPPTVHPHGVDHSVAQHLAGQIHNALAVAADPDLHVALSQALASINKHIAGIVKERQQALQGKVSPRLMQTAYSGAGGPAV